MAEARRFTRIQYQSEVLMNAKGQWLRGMSENLSLYGVYVRSSSKFEIDSVVELTISLPPAMTTSDEEYIDVNGIVVRQDENGFGCEFREVGVDAFINLKNVISSQCENRSLVMDEFYHYLARKELQAS